MNVEWNREPSIWRGSAGFRHDRGRARRKLRICLLVGAAFAYGIVQVGLSTEASRRSDRIHRMKAEIAMVETDLAVSRARLQERTIYRELIAAAEVGGYTAAGPHRVVLAVDPDPVPAGGLAARLADDLKRGSRLLLPDALAQDLWAEGYGRGARP